MTRSPSGNPLPPSQGMPPWEPGTVVELPLLVTGQTAGHLESLATQKGMTIGSFIRSLLDESLARERRKGVPTRSGPGSIPHPLADDCPSE